MNTELVDMVLWSSARAMKDGGQDIGKPFKVDLAIQSGTGEPVPFATVQAILCWSRGLEIEDPLGEEVGPYRDWTKMQADEEHFFDDKHIGGLNDDMDDGELLYVAMANFSNYPIATSPDGLPIHRWAFKPKRMGKHRVWIKPRSGKFTRSYVQSSKRSGVEIQRQPLVKIYTQTDDPNHRR